MCTPSPPPPITHTHTHTPSPQKNPENLENTQPGVKRSSSPTSLPFPNAKRTALGNVTNNVRQPIPIRTSPALTAIDFNHNYSRCLHALSQLYITNYLSPHISYSDDKLPNRTMLMTCAVCFWNKRFVVSYLHASTPAKYHYSQLIPLCLDLYTLSASSPLFLCSPSPSSLQPVSQHPLKPLKTTTIPVQSHRLTESVEPSHSRYVLSHPHFLNLCQFNRVP